MKQALILGCSHALGAEMAKDPNLDQYDKWVMARKFDQYGASNSYPVQIAQALGYTPRNHGISGGSNDAMFRIFCNEFDTLDKSDLVIACWTGVARTELLYESGARWVSLSHGDAHTNELVPDSILLQGICIPSKIPHHREFEDYGRQWLLYEGNNPRGHLNKIKNILALNMLAQSRHIPVINIDSFWPVSDHEWPASIHWPVPETDFIKFCRERNFAQTDWRHYFLPAHQAFANYVLKNLAA
jgi:hypothetical protein